MMRGCIVTLGNIGRWAPTFQRGLPKALFRRVGKFPLLSPTCPAPLRVGLGVLGLLFWGGFSKGFKGGC